MSITNNFVDSHLARYDKTLSPAAVGVGGQAKVKQLRREPRDLNVRDNLVISIYSPGCLILTKFTTLAIVRRVDNFRLCNY